MFGWTRRDTKQEGLRRTILRDLAHRQVALIKRCDTLEEQGLRLTARVEAAERQAQLARDCMNRVTELALVACSQPEMAERFRAQAATQERVVSWDDEEQVDDSPMDEWPPPNCVVGERR